ncbi:MalY/PatB family protein [Aestuariibaculum sediminum]|uniref:cysteine-S-conjugate beta-lyase n=1 Tax=Aestuariibaculum sediminum TaxID=2770637 RepID=A0A8J6U984_9FLAO|nr:PatB family C-S lyase [Aestuariibaculum sediminum]MBD0832772.1 putative C-S lyase [Aestuariibaculum sediminum]
MSIFDIEHSPENNFVKNNPKYLKSMFGTAELQPFWIADMDFKVASAITESQTDIVERGIYAYEDITPMVTKAISDWNFRRHNLKLNPEYFIQVNGVLTAIAILLRTLSEEGDGVMIQTPVYHQFFSVIKGANRKIIDNPLKFENSRYTFDFEQMENQLKSESTKIILLCNPHNPVGRVWHQKELETLIKLANQYQVTIVSDEVHSEIVYSNSKFNSILSFSNTENHIAILGSPAKTFGMQSNANGYIYVQNKELFEKNYNLVTSMYLHHGGALTAYGTLAAYTKGEVWVNELVMYLEETVNWIDNFLINDLPQITMIKPEGTYQVWLDFSKLKISEDELKELMFKNAKLGLAPGYWFGDQYNLFMRMNIASPKQKIEDAFKTLKQVIDNL